MLCILVYSWFTAGTIVPTDKKSRAGEDVPFLKLSNGAKLGVERGWFREAVLQLTEPTFGKKYYIQATTWRDKKQVCFLSTHVIGASVGLMVKRHSKRKKTEAGLQRSSSAARLCRLFQCGGEKWPRQCRLFNNNQDCTILFAYHVLDLRPCLTHIICQCHLFSVSGSQMS